MSWTKATVYVACNWTLAGPEQAPVDGYLDRKIAISKHPKASDGYKDYYITHYPSGLGIDSTPLLKDAKRLVSELRKAFKDVDELFDRSANNRMTDEDSREMVKIKKWLKQRRREASK
jgi:hypothetical protein